MTPDDLALVATAIGVSGTTLAVAAQRRATLAAAALVALMPAPLLMAPAVAELHWVLAAAFYLVSVLLASFLLVVGPRAADGAVRGAPESGGAPSPTLLWIVLVPAALVAGAAAWPYLARATDVATGAAAQAAATLDPARLAMAMAWAAVAGAIALLTASDVRRLAVATGLLAVGAQTAASALDRTLAEALLPATGLLLIAACATATWLSPRTAAD